MPLPDTDSLSYHLHIGLAVVTVALVATLPLDRRPAVARTLAEVAGIGIAVRLLDMSLARAGILADTAGTAVGMAPHVVVVAGLPSVLHIDCLRQLTLQRWLA